MPHVLHVLTVPDSLIFLSGQLGFLSAAGYRFTVVTSPGPSLDAFLAREGVPGVGVRMTRRMSPLADMNAVRRVAAVIRDVRPDIVHGHTPKGGLVAMVAARLAGVERRLYHMRGLPMQTAQGPSRVLLELAERTSCSLASRVICVSTSLQAAAVSSALVPARKTLVLAGGSGNGVDAEHRFNPSRLSPDARAMFRARHGIPHDASVIGFVGRLVRDKGILDLALAWQQLRETNDTLHLLIVGDFEPRDAVPRATRDLLLADPRVHLAGVQTDMPEVFAAMDLLVHPSHREGFPNVVLEAAAMEVPCVATRVTGCVDAIVDGSTGRLVQAGAPLALAEAVAGYLSAPETRQEHGRAARARARREFTPSRIWEALDALYRELLAT